MHTYSHASSRLLLVTWISHDCKCAFSKCTLTVMRVLVNCSNWLQIATLKFMISGLNCGTLEPCTGTTIQGANIKVGFFMSSSCGGVGKMTFYELIFLWQFSMKLLGLLTTKHIFSFILGCPQDFNFARPFWYGWVEWAKWPGKFKGLWASWIKQKKMFCGQET